MLHRLGPKLGVTQSKGSRTQWVRQGHGVGTGVLKKGSNPDEGTSGFHVSSCLSYPSPWSGPEFRDGVMKFTQTRQPMGEPRS